MLEPVSIGVAITLLVKSAPAWLPAISEALIPPVRDALLGKGAERTFDWLGGQRRKIFHLDEKEQKRHLELALKNAVERGLAQFHAAEEQQKYTGVISVLSTSHADALRREAMRLFTLNDEPDFEKLAMLFDQACSQAQPMQGQAIDASPYLASFFESLIAELYADPYFRQQMSDVLQVRAGLNMQRSLVEVLNTLNQIGEILADNYKPEQFEKDVLAYTSHVERTLRYLKLVGVVPKERTNENRDPELDGIFVPLRIAAQENIAPNQKTPDSLVDFFVQTSCMVLLGSPGSGKSTATRYLAWSHAVANLANSTSLTNTPLVSGKPLPLRIELRRLNEDRRQRPEYDFLSYASEVLLGRAGLNIPPQMFELLLERRAMLLLFDGLDEVATLDDRRTLVEEIESFARQYPGNRFLVTSRPVGYNLAPLSTQIFTEAEVQPFDDDQIHQFLENWYSHVMRLSPHDRQELEELNTNLKDNPRLHSLAENPLLLTVITALHRYERLPDKRILVYDRCADLLLETWARLKGTNARWQYLKLSKEDQYACVAHLGFVLHKRSKEEKKEEKTSTDETAVDVPDRFMLQEIERFLDQQNLFTSKANARKQASRFLDLIKEEAGLIVERGTDENGEALYGFVHRTFQEYFAAAHIHEQYQQENDPSIISEFLRENLHDPHWPEVILLLLGKLKSKPVTLQLRQILEGKITSRRSKYTDILQQDLFFVCECLVSSTKVERRFAEQVVSQLGKLVNVSAFQSQQEEAWGYLKALMQTREYVSVVSRELIPLIFGEDKLGLLESLEALIIIHQYSPADLVELRQTIEQLVQSPDYAFEQLFEAIQTLWQDSRQSEGSDQGLHFLISVFLALGKRPHLTTEQTLQVIQAVFQDVPARREPKYGDTVPLPPLPTIPPFLSIEAKLQANQMLSTLSKHPNLSVEQALRIAQMLYQYNLPKSEEESMATRMFLALIQNPDIPPIKKIQIARTLHQNSVKFSAEEQLAWSEKELASQGLLTLIKRPDISVEQALHIIPILDDPKYSLLDDNKWIAVFDAEKASQTRPDISFKEHLQAAQVSHDSIIENLIALIKRPDLSFEERLQVAQILHEHINSFKKRERINQVLLSFLKRHDFSVEQHLQIIQVLLDHYILEQEREAVLQALLTFIQRTDVSFLQAAQILAMLPSSIEQEDLQSFVEVFEQRFALVREQVLQVALTFLDTGPTIRGKYTYLERVAINTVVELIQNSTLSKEQTFQVVQALCKFYDPIFGKGFPKGVPDKQVLFRLLSEMAQDKTLPVSRRVFAIERIFATVGYDNDLPEDIVGKAYSMLLGIPQDETLPLRERVLVAIDIIATRVSRSRFSYDDTLTFTNEEGEQFLTDYLLVVRQQEELPETSPDLMSLTLAYYVKLVGQAILPSEIRDGIYQFLRNNISVFDEIPASPE